MRLYVLVPLWLIDHLNLQCVIHADMWCDRIKRETHVVAKIKKATLNLGCGTNLLCDICAPIVIFYLLCKQRGGEGSPADVVHCRNGFT